MKFRCQAVPAREKQFSKRGTTLIELLVVIVVFLIGILAVIQIFPKGFQLLVATRNNSVAQRLADDAMERYKMHPDQLPDQIVAVKYIGGTTPIQDPTRDPYDLGPQGDAVDSTGILSVGGTNIGNWLLASGPNTFRRVIAETTRVPSPRPVGTNYGGLMVLNFGPIDPNPNNVISTYANDLTKDSTLPPNLTAQQSQNITVSSGTVSTGLYDTNATLATYEYFVNQAATSNAQLLLPTNANYTRTYHIKVGVYLKSGPTVIRQDYTDLLVQVPNTTTFDTVSVGNTSSTNVTPQLINVPVATLLGSSIPNGYSFIGIDYDSMQVAPEFNQVAIANTFSGDPFEYKLLDSNLGVLLFSPNGYSTFVERPGGPREPLLARVNYDVYDWRVLHQEVRLDSQLGLNGGTYGQFSLDLQSIKVGTANGPDGLKNGGIAPIEAAAASYAPTQSSLDDNLVIVDLQTGGVLYEQDPNDQHLVVSINKSTGVVTINGDGPVASGLVGYLDVPGTTTPVQVDLTGRPLRVDYRGRNEYSVNVLKAAANYQSIYSLPFSAAGQVYGQGNILSFPPCERHQQITIDTINYTDASGVAHVVNGQPFVIENLTGSAATYPQINLASVLPAGAIVNSVSGIKGASIIAQVLWNPASFNLGSSATTNLQTGVDNWERNWRVNRVETTIPAQELQ